MQSPGGVRTGDTIEIDGGYQHRALTEGFVVQRFWHHLKTVTIERVAPPSPGMAVLDLGCGSGVVADWLAARGATVDAVDANPRAVAYASRTFARENLAFHLATAEALPFPEGRFDRVYVLEFIEHLYEGQLAALFARLRAHLKPAGTVFLTTPNYRSPWPLLERAMDGLGLAPHMEGEQHVSHPTPRFLRALAAGSGFEVVRQGRFAGVAPFAAALSWRLAEGLDRLEDRAGCPLGSLLYALWRKA
jgi:2-polyprenyl-3-methyl-5-hydroxy-6-metoxy-1,4-benzoquinol methylase